MAIVLTDDGTMDTVLRCSECGEEFRYNYDPSAEFEIAEDGHTPTDEEAEAAYDAFVEWAIEDAASEHVCESDESEE